jgi:pyruvate dehydrogenase E1 component alpha subunit
MHGASSAPHSTLSSSSSLDDGGIVRVLREDGTVHSHGEDEPIPALSSLVAIYRAMVRSRALDERLVALQRGGRIAFHVGSQGEEAAILGSAAALRERDWIFPCYREFAAALWRGMPLAAYVNHMFGNAEDPIKGRQMPDHFGAKVARFTSISSPVGTQITQATGFAWAAKIKKDDVAALVYFGEGATSAGEFHNGINFAGVFRAPVVLFCRNNGWTASPAAKGIAYGVPSVRCDGNDLLAVLKVTRDALARASRGEGATLIEALTARMPVRAASHEEDGASGANAKSVSASDAAWKKRDPLARVRRLLESRGAWSDAAQRDEEASALREIDAAIDAAEKLGPPPLASLFDDVFGALTPQLAEQRAELLAAPRDAALRVLAKP